MKSEEIYIDNVNVAECKEHFTHYDYWDNCDKDMCDAYNAECKPRDLGCLHYIVNLETELKRLEKENEELRNKPTLELDTSYIRKLEKENAKLKSQYNCYACGNCNGKEDYINLEKHHKGLRKQFDELAKRNNTLSLRIEELENENEKLKEYFKDLQVRKDRYYLQVLELERQISDWVTFYMKISDIVSGNYEILDSQGLQDLRQIISEVAK